MGTQQIGLRLQERYVRHLDAQVAAGHAKSRGAYVERMLARDMRRKQALEDLEKIKLAGRDADAAAIASYNASHPLDLSDLD